MVFIRFNFELNISALQQKSNSVGLEGNIIWPHKTIGTSEM